jgi:peptidoglycan/LPS O-acetylase OafA/YrhL
MQAFRYESTQHNPQLKYRPDIDGLRAIAIIAVVVFHVFPERLPGGFLGVDVFFVISGFLISTIIAKRIEAGSFSIVEFYSDRIRRIYPALVLVLIATMMVGRNVMLPNELKLLGKHVAWSAGFIENFLLRSESSYFDISTILKPLMHLWSLAIEEQFYIFFPMIAILAARFRLNLLIVISIIGLASLIHYIASDPVTAFFSPLSRAWELSIGVACGVFKLQRDKQRSLQLQSVDLRSRAVVGGIGLALILVALVNAFQTVEHSVIGLLMATIGTAASIMAGREAWPNRYLLSARGLVWVGLISYPLYLWHWPVLSFWTILEGRSIDTTSRLWAVVLSVALAVATYAIVEQPIRRRATHKLAKAGALLATLLACIASGLLPQYWGRQYDARVEKIIRAWDFAGYPTPAGTRYDEGVALIGDNQTDRIMLIGDSHAEQYKNALAAAVRDSGGNPAEIVYMSSQVLPQQEKLEKWLADPGVKRIVISYFWSIKYFSQKIDYEIRCCGAGLFNTTGGGAPAAPSDSQMAAIDQEILDFLTMFRRAGKDVYVVLDNPFGNELSPRGLVRRSVFRRLRVDLDRTMTRADAIDRTEPARSRLTSIARAAGANIIDPIAFLCSGSACPAAWADGSPIYKDYDHLSMDAVRDPRYFDIDGKDLFTGDRKGRTTADAIKN